MVYYCFNHIIWLSKYYNPSSIGWSERCLQLLWIKIYRKTWFYHARICVFYNISLKQLLEEREKMVNSGAPAGPSVEFVLSFYDQKAKYSTILERTGYPKCSVFRCNSRCCWSHCRCGSCRCSVYPKIFSWFSKVKYDLPMVWSWLTDAGCWLLLIFPPTLGRHCCDLQRDWACRPAQRPKDTSKAIKKMDRSTKRHIYIYIYIYLLIYLTIHLRCMYIYIYVHTYIPYMCM